MGVREWLAEIKEDANKYFKERDTIYVEYFFMGYCAANNNLSDDILDRNFYSYFETWVQFWIEDNVAPPHYGVEEPFFQGYREILPKEKEEFTYFLELCDLCIEDYEKGGSIIHFPWKRKRSKENRVPSLRALLLYQVKLRPQMFAWNLRLDLMYYYLFGHCSAYYEAGFFYEEIDTSFCQEFGEWLMRWIRENVDRNYMPQSKYWYEDIRRILPEGRKELDYFLELCELFFEDYDVGKGFDQNELAEGYWNHKVVEICETIEIPEWRPRK